MKQGIIAAVVIVVLAIGGFVLMSQSNDTNDNADPNSSSSVTPTRTSNTNDDEDDAMTTPTATATPEQSGGTGTDDTASALITYGSGGFSQSTVTVKSGSKITITNNATKDAEPASDPHPQHTDNPELNFGDIEPGGSKTVTVTKTGTWGLHDHNDASKKMTIIVQ